MLSNVLVPQTFLPLNSVRIGRLVLNVDEPQADYLDFVDEAEVIIKEHENYTGQAATATDKGFTSSLTTLVSAKRTRQKNAFTRITTTLVKTYQMSNSGLWFTKSLQYEKTRTWIEQAVRQGDDVYLVVGYHTMLDAQVTEEGGVTDETTGSVEVPVTAALTATGVVIPLEGVLDPTVGGHSKRSQGEQKQFVAPGEQICAVQYRKLRFKWYSSRDLDSATLGPNQWKTYWSVRGSEARGIDVVESELQDDLELEGNRKVQEIHGEGHFVF
jgi:hypothetical protein